MKIWKRGGVRLAVEKGDFVVYIDADKLADADEFDTPEVELFRVSADEAKAEGWRFWENVKAEAKRVKKRGIKVRK